MKYTYNPALLRPVLKRHRIKVVDLGKTLNVTWQQASRYLSCLSEISLSNLLEMCNAYQIPLSEFIIDEDNIVNTEDNVKNGGLKDLVQFISDLTKKNEALIIENTELKMRLEYNERKSKEYKLNTENDFPRIASEEVEKK